MSQLKAKRTIDAALKYQIKKMNSLLKTESSETLKNYYLNEIEACKRFMNKLDKNTLLTNEMLKDFKLYYIDDSNEFLLIHLKTDKGSFVKTIWVLLQNCSLHYSEVDAIELNNCLEKSDDIKRKCKAL